MTNRPRSPHCVLLISLLVLTVAGPALLVPAASADPIESPGGAVVLPLTGLALDLPLAASGCGYRLSGSWAIDASGSYDGRDVLDEACGDSLTSGNWVSMGYFTAGSDSAVVAAEVGLEKE